MDRALHATEQYFQRTAVLLILVVLTLEPLGDALTNRTEALSLYAWLLLRSVRTEVAQCILGNGCGSERSCDKLELSDRSPSNCSRIVLRAAFPVSRLLTIDRLQKLDSGRQTLMESLGGPLNERPAPKWEQLTSTAGGFLFEERPAPKRVNLFYVPIVSDPALGHILADYAFKVPVAGYGPGKRKIGVFALPREDALFGSNDLIEASDAARDLEEEGPRRWAIGVAAYRLHALGAKFDAPTDLTLTTPQVDIYVRQALTGGFTFLGIQLNAGMAWAAIGCALGILAFTGFGAALSLYRLRARGGGVGMEMPSTVVATADALRGALLEAALLIVTAGWVIAPALLMVYQWSQPVELIEWEPTVFRVSIAGYFLATALQVWLAWQWFRLRHPPKLPDDMD
jgi:hypothetical protein